MASQLLALGWGIDFAAAIAQITDGSAPPLDLEHFTPTARGGNSLRIPEVGFLEHLGECHQAFTHRITRDGINPYTRPTRLGGKDRAVLVALSDERKVLPFYTRKATVWHTVTPVILHGYNAARGRISLTKTNRLLCQAFDAAGFPEPLIDNITFQAAPFWPGSGAANAIRVPRHLLNWPRVHVRVEFKEALTGPVLAGLGRHSGIGTFAAAQE